MLVHRESHRRLSAAVVALVVAPAVAVLVLSSSRVEAQVGPIDCPEPVPLSEVTRGMVGTGWTTSEGTEPEPFSAEVMGILEDGIAPNRHLIVVDTSSPAIQAAGGVWHGISGSPVYHEDGRLLGAVSRVMASGPTTVAGLTPAQDLFKLLSYPDATTGDSQPAESSPAWLSERSPSAAGDEYSDPNSFKRLRLPLHVSGMTRRGVRRLTATINRERAPLIPYTGSSSSSALAPPEEELHAGDSFAAALSYGDVTLATIGTTALVCEARAVAFGHSVNWTGRTEMGANAASTVGIVPDDRKGPYKLAEVQGLAGTVDQDRLAGVRAILTTAPDVSTVRSNVTSLDTGLTELGQSVAVLDRVMPSLAFYHLIGHMDATFDQITGGSSKIYFKIEGVTEAGAPFRVVRRNVFSTHEDISITSAHELERYLWTLLSQEFEEIDFTSVFVKASVGEERRQYRIRDVLVSRNGGPFKGTRSIKARGGDTLDLRVELKQPNEDALFIIEMQLKVPKGARGHAGITVTGGPGFEEGLSCFFRGDICKVRLPKKIDSFEEVLTFLRRRPRNHILNAILEVRSRTVDTDRERLDRFVKGAEFVRIELPGGDGNGEGPIIVEPIE